MNAERGAMNDEGCRVASSKPGVWCVIGRRRVGPSEQTFFRRSHGLRGRTDSRDGETRGEGEGETERHGE